VAYNLGNTQFVQKKYKEALDSYRKAMRCNPNDEDAKFNYALTKLKLQQQEQQQNQDNKQDNQDNNDKQNQQDNKDKQDKENEEKNDKNQDKQPQNQNGNEDKQQGGQRPEGGMSPEQQEALLQAVQAEEDKTQDKLKEAKGVLLIHGGKNW
jgi:tetratricopeptide (TPR) repeat protein